MPQPFVPTPLAAQEGEQAGVHGRAGKEAVDVQWRFARHLGIERRVGQALHLEVEAAGLGELLQGDAQPLAHRPAHGKDDRQLDAVGMARLGQKLAGGRRIGLRNDDILGVEGMAGRDRADRLDALAEQCQLDDFFLVDGKMEGLAHALVVEGRDVVVQDRAVPRGGGYAVDPELGAGGQGLHLLERQVPQDLDVAGLQGRDLDAHLRDDAQLNPVDLGQARFEITGMARQHEAIAGGVAHELERAGADRLRGEGRGAARHDLDLAVGEDIGESAIGDGELEHDRGGIGRGDALDHVVLAAHGRRAGRVEQAPEGGDDIVGHHLLPVMELHAAAQAECPALEVVAVGPALGQVGLHDEVFAHARQAVEDEVGVDVLVARRHHHGIEGVERRADADAQHVGRGLGGPDGDGCRRSQGRADQRSAGKRHDVPFNRWAGISTGVGQVFAQGAAGIFVAQQAAALQLRRHHAAELLVGAGEHGGRQDEAVAGAVGEPVLHHVGDHGRRAGQQAAWLAHGRREADALGLGDLAHAVARARDALVAGGNLGLLRGLDRAEVDAEQGGG